MYEKLLVKWHNQIGWGAAIALLIWGVSSIMHPLMTWFGPQPENTFPPAMQVEGSALDNLPVLLRDLPELGQARVIKLVPGEEGPMLQLTHNQNTARQYYDLITMQFKPDQDLQQATWLASHYSGLAKEQIARVDFMTEYTDEYPMVNRLLPVYRIEFEDRSGKVAFIHTETGALASLSSTFKDRSQWIFQYLHTFKWLDSLESGRLLLMSFFMLSLLATAIVGLLLVFSLKPRPIRDGKRRYHRRLAYVAWLPLLAWSASGFYHLLQSSLVEPQFGIRLDEPFDVRQNSDLSTDSLSRIRGQTLNSLTLIRDENRDLFWRASIAKHPATEPVSRERRFAGMTSEANTLYLPATSEGQARELDDRSLAVAMAQRFLGAPADQVMETTLITSFGADYDFRNKRLPVWEVRFADADATVVYIDTTTGVLADSSRSVDRIERWSFSVLHKWNHLNSLTGTQIRDVLIVATIGLLLIITLLGLPLLIKRRKPKSVPLSDLTPSDAMS